MAAKKSPMARNGKSNGRWKGGTSKTYYRKKAGAKTGDGKIVHHKDGNPKNSKRSNLKLISPKKGVSATGMHNKQHPNRSKGDGRPAYKIKSKSK